MYKQVYAILSELPAVLHHYKNTSVPVAVTDELVSVNTSAGDGYREIIRIFNLNTGKSIDHVGDWGGASYFRTKSIDHTGVEYEIEPHIMIAIISQGGTNAHQYGRVSQVYIHPDRFQIKEAVSLTDDQLKMLNVMCYTSGYRAEYARNYKVGSPTPDNPLVVELIKLGLVKKAGKGVSLTAEGRNTLDQNRRKIDQFDRHGFYNP